MFAAVGWHRSCILALVLQLCFLHMLHREAGLHASALVMYNLRQNPSCAGRQVSDHHKLSCKHKVVYKR